MDELPFEIRNHIFFYLDELSLTMASFVWKELASKRLNKKDFINTAAKTGNVGCFKYAHENGCPWSSSTYYIAAKAGNLECLKCAHKNGCPLN